MTFARCAAFGIAVASVGGCGGSAVKRPLSMAPGVGMETAGRSIAPDEVVPPFQVVTATGDVIDSRELIGRTPFVVLFFASWCQICDAKVPATVRTLERYAGGPVVAVSTDDDETWPDVPRWAERHGLRYSIVQGSRTPFTRAYDPFGGVPLLLVVGADGRLVEVQLGYAPDDEERLTAALELASSAVRRGR